MEDNGQTFFDREYKLAYSMKEFGLILRGERHLKLINYGSEWLYEGRPDLLDFIRNEKLNHLRNDLTLSIESIRRDYINRFYRLEGITDSTLGIAFDRLNVALDQLPRDLIMQETVFKEWRLYLIDAIKAMQEEILRRPEKKIEKEEKQVDDVDLVRAQIKISIETEQKLMQDCEEEVVKYPEQEAQIRRIYRRAIDRLREQQ